MADALAIRHYTLKVFPPPAGKRGRGWFKGAAGSRHLDALRGWAWGVAVLPVVELVRGSPGLSVASHSLCPLTLLLLQVPLAPQKPPAPVKPLAPPPTARRPRLRQNCQHHCAPGPAWIFSVPSRPAAA
jgi:hypothetical protein